MSSVTSRTHSHKDSGSMGSRDGVEERDTVLMRGFYKAGTKMTPRFRDGIDVSGSRNGTLNPDFSNYGLNFSGDQQYRAMSASSSTGQKQKSNHHHNMRRFGEGEHAAGGANSSFHKGIPVAVSEELVAGVKRMGMDQVLPDLNDQVLSSSPERVSGINSFEESTGGTESARLPPEHARQITVGKEF